jgi:hypothetical protein
MSMTVDRLISSIARDEYSFGEEANSRKRPRFIIGAAIVAAAAPAVDFNISRRVSFAIDSLLVKVFPVATGICLLQARSIAALDITFSRPWKPQTLGAVMTNEMTL